jgi:hypothetical protein
MVPEPQWPGVKFRTTGRPFSTGQASNYMPPPAGLQQQRGPSPSSEAEPGSSKTYDEWKDLGYHVVRGEKATGRNVSGMATFSPDQVEEDEDDSGMGWEGNEDE